MSDEAREAAWEIYNLAYRDDAPAVRAEKDATLAVYAAGVAEGIRQAREAVAKHAPVGDGSYEDEWMRGNRFAYADALRTIDALTKGTE